MEDKVALVTGAAQGIGRAIVEALLQTGVKVSFADINTAAGLQTLSDLQRAHPAGHVTFHTCDVTSAANVEDVLQKTVADFGHIDILVNNAGIANETDWEKTLDINLRAVIQSVQLGLKYMGKAVGRKDGLIVNIASSAGFLPTGTLPAYTASKHGVVGYTRALGVMSPRLHGVRINCLCPTFVNTELFNFTEGDSFYGERSHDVMRKLADKVGMMVPREVAESLLELVSHDSLSAGTMIVTPGGRWILRMPSTLDEVYAAFPKL